MSEKRIFGERAIDETIVCADGSHLVVGSVEGCRIGVFGKTSLEAADEFNRCADERVLLHLDIWGIN